MKVPALVGIYQRGRANLRGGTGARADRQYGRAALAGDDRKIAF